LVLAFGLPFENCLSLQPAPQLAAKLPGRHGQRNSCRRLNEGSLLFIPVLLPDVSFSEVKRIMAWQDQVIQTPRSRIRRRQAGPRRDRHRPRTGADD